MCPTAQTYQDYQTHQGVEGAEVGGLYKRIVIKDFLSQYPGRPPFQPGYSEYGATKPWTGSPMASLQRAVIMLRKLNLYGIPREIRDALRRLQDAYSDELDLDGSDTSSQGSAVAGETEDIDCEEGREEICRDRTREDRAKSQETSRASRRSANRDREQDCEEPGVEEDKEGSGASKCEDYSEVNPEVVLSYPRLHDIGTNCVSEPDRNASRLWRWGPCATSEDAAKFFQRVLYS